MSDLTSRRFLVSGASSGIGEATARALAAAGARVAVLARREDRLVSIAEATGAVAVPADVTQPGEVEAAVRRAAERIGGIDGLINVAGVVRHGSPTLGDPADWELMLHVNVFGLLAVTRAAAPFLMDAPHSDVVNVGSTSGIRRASVRSTVYSGTKFAVHTISDGMREELAPSGVRVAVVAPGYVDTEIFDSIADPEARKAMKAKLAEGLDARVIAQQVVHIVSQPVGVCIETVVVSSM